MSELFQALQSASPFAVLAMTVAWALNRVLQFILQMRGDPKFGRLTQSMDEQTQEARKVVDGLKRLEAATLQHAVAHERCAFVAQSKGEERTKAVMSLKDQRLMIEYQWNWCRDEFVKILKQSIRNNGICGHEEGVALRVVNALNIAAKDSRMSLERLDGVSNYQFTQLYHRDIQRIIQRSWELALPIYHRDIQIPLEEALNDFELEIRGLFARAYGDYILGQEDPDTGDLYRKGEPAGTSPSGIHPMSGVMAEMLKQYVTVKESGPHPAIEPRKRRR